MWSWFVALLTSLFSWGTPAPTPLPQKDYVGYVAAEAAYSALIPVAEPTKPKVPTKDCTTCNGTGRVRTGDGQGWTKCPDCEGLPGGDTISR